ncbi:MAG: hypothetical protein HUU01_23795, partial [Saprospiraceae bacterium]|nr:hypothetical protein [Saprospiraceae bacterium]
MYRPINPLSLTATLGDPNPALSHGRAMQSGVHLRWAFDPEFGYPEGGFELFRIVGESIDLIYKWTFEKTLLEIIQDHNQSGYYDNWIQKIPSNIENFHDQLRKLEPRYHLANPKPLERFSHALLLDYENQDHKKHKARIGVLNSILLAATDPNFAKIAGLYFVDTFPQSQAVEGPVNISYCVGGIWGNQRSLQKEIKFEDFKEAELKQALRRDIVSIYPSMGGKFAYEQIPYNPDNLTPPSPRFFFSGPGNRKIRFVFDRPVEEFTLSGAEIRTMAQGVWLDKFLFQAAEISQDSIIIKRPGMPFNEVELWASSNLLWVLNRLAYRIKSGELGNQISSVQSITNNGANQLSNAPVLGVPWAEPATPVLNEQGRLEMPKSQVNLTVQYFHPNLNLPTQPIKYIFGKRDGASIELNPSEIFNDASLNRLESDVLPDLLAWFPFDGDIRERKSKISPTVHGKPRFSRHTPPDTLTNLTNASSSVRTVGNQSVFFNGDTRLELDHFPLLN